VGTPERHADLLVLGRIATLAGRSGFGWTEGIAIGGGRVLATGDRDSLEGLRGAGTRLIVPGPDLVVLPGLTDAHLHLGEQAVERTQVLLEGAATMEEGLALVAAAHRRSPDGEAWLRGGGWDPLRWGRWPTAAELRSAAPGRLVALWSHDHHALWCSEEALRRAGVTADTPEPAGGIIRRDGEGAPTGCLQDSAVELVLRHLPPPDQVHVRASILALCGGLLDVGIVAVHDPGDLGDDGRLGGSFQAVRELADSGDLPVRVHASVRAASLPAAIAAGLRTGAPLGGGDDCPARMGWLKLFADGALGSRTALTLEPYEGWDDRGARGDRSHGVEITSTASLRALAVRAARAGIATQIHAIGDAALRSALDALEGLDPPSVGARAGSPMARIEHVQLADPADRRRFAAAGVAASIQPVHLRGDRDKAIAAWGARAERSGYPLRSLLRAGAVVAFGSDAPVEPFDPWPGIEMAVTRRSAIWSDRRPFGRDEAISLAAAIRSATVAPAVLAGELDRGRLTRGQRADFVVVPAEALAGPVEPGGRLGRVRPELVAVGGRVVRQC
jgi:hypothetical protein